MSMQIVQSAGPSMFSTNFGTDDPCSGSLANGFANVEEAIAACMRDDRFQSCKPIVRSLYSKPKDLPDYSAQELEELRESMGSLKVSSYQENSNAQEIPAPFSSFEQAFSNKPEILAQIRKYGFEKPSAIQAQLWPLLLSGRDCIGVSQTGSGKTLAFLLPAFLHIEAQYELYGAGESKPCPSVLVLTPTRELAQQIEREVEKYSYNGYKSVCLYGGASRRDQMAICNRGVEIVIATPGRLADLAAEGVITLSTVSYVVLDEADRMLDMGFEPSIKRILFEIRPDRLVALTSATWPESVRRLADKYTKDAVMVVVGSLDLSSCQSVRQEFNFLREENKFERMLEVVAFLDKMHGDNYKLIIFVKAKGVADHLACDFCLKGINAQGLHGGRSQEDRENSLADFRSGEVKILIATNLASRGIDVPDITHVVNYDFPGDIEEYVHRVGRTGRAGRSGEALTFMTWSDRFHAAALIEILEKSKQEIPAEIHRLASEHAKRKENGFDRPRQFQRRSKDNFTTSY